MQEPQQYRINSQSIVHENLDGEVIVIHLETGAYYSFNSVAGQVWTMLEDGSGIYQMADILADRYESSHQQIHDSLVRFLHELHVESLLLKVQFAESASQRKPIGGNGAKLPFEEPHFEKYTDMQEFLQVDPIHEVTDEGWPNRLPTD